MTKPQIYVPIYLLFAAGCLCMTLLGKMPADYIFYCLIISTIWQAADYIKNGKES